jgi:RimJ/RimL family protein N-acetyltransferase
MDRTTLKILKPGDEAALEAFLLPRVDSSMFLLGNMRAAGLVDRGGTFEGSYSAVFDGSEISSVIAHYWNGNLVFQAPCHLDALLQSVRRASGRPVRGLLGPAEQVAEAMTAMPDMGLDLQLDETETLFSLDLDHLVVPESLLRSNLRGRRIVLEDIERVARWTARFRVESLGAEDTPDLLESCRLDVEGACRRGATWILEDGGTPVAISSFNTAIEEAVQIGGVWTPPELRSRGYGRAVVAASLLDARAEGAHKAVLFTAGSNAPARKAYRALGFRPVGNYRLVLLRG